MGVSKNQGHLIWTTKIGPPILGNFHMSQGFLFGLVSTVVASKQESWPIYHDIGFFSDVGFQCRR